MKIRNGFVSNSSSSSFCIFGKEYELDELKKLFEKHIPQEDMEDFEEDPNWYIGDRGEEIFPKLNFIIDPENNRAYVGIQPRLSNEKKEEIVNLIADKLDGRVTHAGIRHIEEVLYN